MITLRFVGSVALLLLAARASAQSPDVDRVVAACTPYLNDDTVAVATVAVDAAWPEGIATTLADYGVVPADELETMRTNMAEFAGVLAAARSLGVREVSAVVALADIRPDVGPLVIISCESPDRTAIEKMVTDAAGQMKLQVATAWQGDHLLVASQANLDRYRSIKPADRSDLLDALRTTLQDKASAGAVAALGQDARRVVRELWPTLPPPARELDGDLLADGVNHLSLSITAPPAWRAQLTLAARDEASAQQFKQTAQRSLAYGVQQASKSPEGLAMIAMLSQAITLLTPQQQGSNLVIDLEHQNEALVSLVKGALLPALGKARNAALRNRQINDMKEIALAMHNYADVNKSFPAAATICNKDGQPLLSWRVAILPYIEQQALYNEFRLDEAWDSPHNLKLARTLVPTYSASMSNKIRDEGKTTYQLPVGPETGFAPDAEAKLIERTIGGRKVYFRQGPSLRQITDGTSQTMLLAQVADEHAVVWTKPDDWQVDVNDPVAKLKQDGRDGFVNAFMDGSARFTPFTAKPDLLKKLLTPRGSEVIDWNTEGY